MILLIDCGSNSTPTIERIVDEYCDVKSIPIFDFKPEELEGIKGVIISSASVLLTEIDPEKYLEKTTWLKETELPVLGISFGHVLIGLQFGAHASRIRFNNDWQLVEAYEETLLFNKLPNEVEMMTDHSESVSIPPGFKLIGSSDACVNEIMQHNSKPIFGVQFNPELSGNHGTIIIENFVNQCIQPPFH